MAFGLDDLPWSESSLTNEVLHEIIELICDRLETLDERNETVEAHNTIFELPRIGSHNLADLLYNTPPVLSVEVRRRALIHFERIKTFDDSKTELEVGWNENTLMAPTTSWVAMQCDRGFPTGCLTARCSGRIGPTTIATNSTSMDVHFVADEVSHTDFFRQIAMNPHRTELDFATLAIHAFPNLLFIDDFDRGLRDLSRPFSERQQVIVRLLGALSDHASDVFAFPGELEIRGQLKALQIEASTETRETLLDKSCRDARTKFFNSRSIVFDWHIKIESHIDRIYFHPPIPESNGKPIIGIVHSHLPLPGD
jgi:hypothetical protein